MDTRKVRLFTGGRHPDLAKGICDCLDLPLGRINHQALHPDGDEKIDIGECVRGCTCIIIQTTVKPEATSWSELFLLIDAIWRAHAKEIIIVVPNYGGARQERREQNRVPITAKVIADGIESCKVSRAIFLDLHADAIDGFFNNTRVEKLTALPLTIAILSDMERNNLVFGGPDLHAAKVIAVPMSKALQPSTISAIAKIRTNDRETETLFVLGDTNGKDVECGDDLLTTGGSADGAANSWCSSGAREVRLNITHPMLVGNFEKNLSNPRISRIRVTNSTPLTHGIPEGILAKMDVLDVAPLFSEAIKVVLQDDPGYPMHRLLTPQFWLEPARRGKILLSRKDWSIETKEERELLELMLKVASQREAKIKEYINATASRRSVP